MIITVFGYSFWLFLTFSYFQLAFSAKNIIFQWYLIFKVFVYFIIIYVPLYILGWVIGRRFGIKYPKNLSIISIPRKTTQNRFFTSVGLILIGGFLVFASIYPGIYLILIKSVNFHYFSLDWTLTICFVLFVACCVTASICNTFFLMYIEDYKWQWPSIFTPASVGLYVFVYFCYCLFWHFNLVLYSEIFNYLWFSFFICFSLAVTAGTIGFVASDLFIQKITSNKKLA